MRLLIVTNDYPPEPGGIQMYLRNLVDAYPDAVHVVGPADANADPSEEGITRGERSYMLPTAATGALVVDAARKFNPDAILFGAPHPLPFLTGRLRRELEIPIGVISYGAEITIPAAVPGLRQVLGRGLAAADVRFALSGFVAERVHRMTGKPVEVLGAGVEIDTFTPSPSPPVNDVPVVGCVSRFVPRKGQARLLEAAARVGNVEVLLVGKGRQESRLRRTAESLGVRTRFAVDVPWSELPGLYKQMDIFCMPCKSRWGGLEVEGLGLVFLEAAATGLPVLAGDSGGSRETVLPGRTGFITTDVDAIAEGLDLLLGDPSNARDMGEQGRRYVESEYTWDRVIERLYGGFAPHLG